MSHVITEAATWVNSVTVPDDGDPATATAGSTGEPLEDPLQVIIDRTRYLSSKLLGLIISRSEFYRYATTELGWGAISFVAGTGLILTLAAGTEDVGSLTADTWYYTYVYDSAGTAMIEHVTDVPDPLTGYVTQTGDATKIYVGCFRVDASQDIIPFRMRAGQYVYERSAIGATWDGLFSGAVGSFATWTDLSFAEVVPPHVRTANLRLSMDVEATTGVSREWRVRTKGDTSHYVGIIAPLTYTAGLSTFATLTADITLDSSQRLQWWADAAATVFNASVELIGFQE